MAEIHFPSVPEDEKVRARQMVRDAVKSGKLHKPKACQDCGEERPLQGHHVNYARPLEVRWLCTTCHTVAHWGTTFVLRVQAAFDEGEITARERRMYLGLRLCKTCGAEIPKSRDLAYCPEHRPSGKS